MKEGKEEDHNDVLPGKEKEDPGKSASEEDVQMVSQDEEQGQEPHVADGVGNDGVAKAAAVP